MKRSANIQAFLDEFVVRAKIEPDFVEASEHPYACTCDKCRQWWRDMGPDPDTGRYGPFGESIEEQDASSN